MEQLILSLLPTLVSLIGPINNLINTGVSVNSVASVVQSPAVISAFQTIGAKLFPKAAPAMQLAGALVTSFNSDYTKWVQNILNSYLAGVQGFTALRVDGIYGQKTHDAVVMAQHKIGGLVADGWAGDLTRVALETALLNLKKAA